MASTLTGIIREEVLQLEGVIRFNPSRRFTSIYRESDPADRVYYLSTGLVKIFHRGNDGKEVILRVAAPGEMFGEEALTEGAVRGTSAEILQEAVIFVVPRNIFLSFAETRPGLWPHLVSALTTRQRILERKIEMLCLDDVETRILSFLRDLTDRLKPEEQTGDFSIPLSQSELASLIGATRETTSTTLNVLARKGIVKLGRRKLIVPSLEALISSASDPSEPEEPLLSVSAQAGAPQ